MVAVNAFRTYGREDLAKDDLDARLALLGALYTGSWTADMRWPWSGAPELIYEHARQIVNNTGSIIDLYEHCVWFGELPAPSNVMQDFDAEDSAIPIIPQTNKETSDQQLLVATYTLFQMWQWQMWMSLIPKTSAIFGDVFVELVDDYQHGTVTPEIIYPGYIPTVDLELNSSGDVKRYAKEYPVAIAASTAFGKRVEADNYLFRKEVDGENFYFYKDGKLFDYPEFGPAVQPNPYGFVPACLFRHELVVGSKRGMGAFEKTITQATELNSTLSSATDYQRKQFGMPIGVIGSTIRAGTNIVMPNGVVASPTATADEKRSAKRKSAESERFLPLAEGGQFVMAQFSIGDTMQMVNFIHDRLNAENPEAQYGIELLQMTQVTGPGGSLILSPIRAKAMSAQKNHNTQMRKLVQQATAMMGFRLNAGVIPREITQARPDRYDAFKPFDLTSYGKGLLDATIKAKDPFPESAMEKAQWLALIQDAPNWVLRRAGISEEEIAAAEEEKQKALQEQMAAFSVAGANVGNGDTPPPQRQGATGQTGPSGPSGASGATGRTA